MWKMKFYSEAEIDIEHLPVQAIERRGSETVILLNKNDVLLRCSLAQHDRFVARFRAKLGLSDNTTEQARAGSASPGSAGCASGLGGL